MRPSPRGVSLPSSPGGAGGMGRKQNKRWTVDWKGSQGYSCKATHCHCYDMGGWHSENFKPYIDPAVPCCQGQTGPSGTPGRNMPNGNAGNNGEPRSKWNCWTSWATWNE